MIKHRPLLYRSIMMQIPGCGLCQEQEEFLKGFDPTRRGVLSPPDLHIHGTSGDYDCGGELWVKRWKLGLERRGTSWGSRFLCHSAPQWISQLARHAPWLAPTGYMNMWMRKYGLMCFDNFPMWKASGMQGTRTWPDIFVLITLFFSSFVFHHSSTWYSLPLGWWMTWCSSAGGGGGEVDWFPGSGDGHASGTGVLIRSTCLA